MHGGAFYLLGRQRLKNRCQWDHLQMNLFLNSLNFYLMVHLNSRKIPISSENVTLMWTVVSHTMSEETVFIAIFNELCDHDFTHPKSDLPIKGKYLRSLGCQLSNKLKTSHNYEQEIWQTDEIMNIYLSLLISGTENNKCRQKVPVRRGEKWHTPQDLSYFLWNWLHCLRRSAILTVWIWITVFNIL